MKFHKIILLLICVICFNNSNSWVITRKKDGTEVEQFSKRVSCSLASEIYADYALQLSNVFLNLYDINDREAYLNQLQIITLNHNIYKNNEVNKINSNLNENIWTDMDFSYYDFYDKYYEDVLDVRSEFTNEEIQLLRAGLIASLDISFNVVADKFMTRNLSGNIEDYQKNINNSCNRKM